MYKGLITYTYLLVYHGSVTYPICGKVLACLILFIHGYT